MSFLPADELFRRQAARTPDAVALRAPGCTLTYGRLEHAADCLAGAIRARSSSPADRVAVLAAHSPAGIAGMLGAIRAGRCFVPLNPRESDGYLESVWHDTTPACIVAEEARVEQAARLCGQPDRVIPVEFPAEGRGTGTPAAAPPDDLAAIIFTSGSTGRPKGVQTTGSAILERARQYAETSRISPADRQASIVPWHYSAAFPDVFGALQAGAELHLYDAHVRGLEPLSAWIREQAITLLQLPVAMLRRLPEDTPAGAWPTVRLVYISGDRLEWPEAEALLARLAPGGCLLYGLGSTETNLVTQFVIPASDEDTQTSERTDPDGDTQRRPEEDTQRRGRSGAVPAGRPVPGKAVVLLDEDGQELRGPGEGEVAVTGPFLSPGYWNQPEATAQAFRETADGRRLFRTGDIGRIRPNGLLELLGRKDARVKIRGIRVDLASVEALLRSLSGVGNAVARTVQSPGGRTELVAYLEPAPGAILAPDRIQKEMRRRAPAHWVPSHVMLLPAFPLTVNGKIDRTALPTPERIRPALATTFIAPRTQIETRLAEIWAEILELNAVGVDDDFFDLGGDSLDLVNAASRIQDRLNYSVPLAEMVPGQCTVAWLAGHFAAHLTAPSPPADLDDRPEEDRFLTGRHFHIPRHPAGSAWHQRLLQPVRGRVLFHGPVAGKLGLPYESGTRLQRFWLARPRLQSLLFPGPVHLMRTWHGILKSPEPLQDIILRSLMANTWLAWRLRALQSPDTFADWVTVGEGEVLDALTRERNRGVVLVVAHTPFNHLLQGLPLLREREFTTIRQPVPRTPAEKADGNHPSLVLQRTLQVQRAMAVLQRRGVVQVAGDGGKGAAGVDVSFHGRQRRFRTGAAELAEATNSVLVPVFTFMNVDGSIRLDFREPLQSNESSTRKRSLDLTHQFASALAGEWPKLYASVRWHVARAMLRPPEWY